jgi:hypothetical protein
MKVQREVKLYFSDGEESALITPVPGEVNFVEVVFENYADRTKCSIALNRDELKALKDEVERMLDLQVDHNFEVNSNQL